MARRVIRHLPDRPSRPRAARIHPTVITGLLLALASVLLALAACAPPAQPSATPTPPAATVAPAPSPTAEAKAIAATASPTLAPSPTSAPSPTLAPSPTPPAPTPTATLRPQPLSAANYPRVDGSTSTQPLQILAACKRLGVPYAWQEDITSQGKERRVQPLPSAVKMPPLQHTGTNQAYMALIQDKTDLILVARQPSEDEAKAAQQAGVKLDIRPVALDAFVFLLNSSNPLQNLSTEQIRGIYTGKETSWTKLGVKAPIEGSSKIDAYRRPRNSGSQELMESLVMRGMKMIDVPDMLQQGMEGMMNAVNQNPRGIGYIVYYYASTMLSYGNIKLIGVDGVMPSAATIANRTFPLVAEVYVVTRADIPTSHPAAIMRDWLLSSEGQAVVAESSYVPLAKTN